MIFRWPWQYAQAPTITSDGTGRMTVCDLPAGDRGQRYEVRYFDGDGVEHVMGWSNAAEGGAMVRSLALHPVWKLSRIVDRTGGERTQVKESDNG